MTSPELPHLALARHPHDRLGNRRIDQPWLDQAWADPETRVLVVSGTRIRVGDEGVTWLPTAEAPDHGILVLLGEPVAAAAPIPDQTPSQTSVHAPVRFALLVAPESLQGDDAEWGSPDEWVPLRGALPALLAEPDEAPWLFHAMGLAEWHWATRFCPRCGTGLEARAAGHELSCPGCGRVQFPRTDPAVIMAITAGEPGAEDEALLLGHQVRWPEDRWSTLAGFCEPGETLEDAVRREVAEEVGVEVDEVTYFGNQPWPLPASLMLGFMGRAATREIVPDGTEIDRAQWFTRAELGRACASGEMKLPRGVSISSSLIEHWYGGPLPGGSSW